MTEAASADTRARIVALARTWLGTPYHHQARVRGAGADCLGLLRGVYAELYGAEPEAPPPYTPSWAKDRGAETLRDAAARCHPAPGRPGSPDKTAAAADQVAAFFGTVAPADLAWNGRTVTSAKAEFSFRRFILHCTRLAEAAGGVDTFLIGSDQPSAARSERAQAERIARAVSG